MQHSKWTDGMLKLRERVRHASNAERARVLSQYPKTAQQRIAGSPYILARDKQLEAIESDADTILILCGRGWGKGWTGAHWLLDRIQRGHRATAVVAETAADVRDDIVEPAEIGSGLVEFARNKKLKPNYKRSESRIELVGPEGSSRVQTYSGDSPDSLRGFSGSVAWIDELAKMRYAEKVLNQVNLTLREGGKGAGDSQLLITTTPRPIPVIKELVEDPTVHVITGSSLENEANLDSRILRQFDKMRGTRLGKQEVGGVVLEDVGDLWKYADIQTVNPDDVPPLRRICVGLDPSVSDSKGDEAGIVVVGLGNDGNAYVLADLSGQYTTREWGAITIAAYQGDLDLITDYLDEPFSEDVQKAVDAPYDWRPADCIHAETNQGGALVTQQLRSYNEHAAVNATHTNQSKDVRAEPVHNLYQRSKVFHVYQRDDARDGGHLAHLEDQLTDFQQDGSGDSPDRADALVYSVWELFDLDGKEDDTSDAFDTILGIN